MTELKLSIIIVSFNVKELLKECLESLRQVSIPLEVFVVDNASQDKTLRMLKTDFGDWPAIAVISNDENVGFAKANNQALPKCSGRYILLLNPDTIAEPGAIEALVNYLDSHPEIGVLGCKLVYPDGSLQSMGERFPSIWEIFKEQILFSKTWRRFFQYTTDIIDDFREVDYVSGACLMTRRNVIDNVGLFKEDYFMYGEDLEFCYRVKQMGWKVGVLTKVKIIHLHSKSTEQNLSDILVHSIQNSVKNIELLRGRTQAKIGFVLYIVGLIIRSILAIFRQDKALKDYATCIKTLLSTNIFQKKS